MSMAVRKQPKRLKDIAALLADGEKVRELCPYCGGGSTGEKSFAIERRGSYAGYKCYRASCDAKGRVYYGGLTPAISKSGTSNTPPKVNRFLGDSHKLTVNYSQYFKNKFNIQPMLMQEYGVKITDDGRVLFPIIGPTGAIRGDNLRTYEDLTPKRQNVYQNKSTIYIPEGEPILSWHRLRGDAKCFNDYFKNVLIILEDQVSAIKASRMVDSVALLGTDLNMTKILEIGKESGMNNKYTTVIILLDNDAYKTALRHVMRTRAILPGVSVRKLERDVKDMTYADLLSLIKEIMETHEQ